LNIKAKELGNVQNAADFNVNNPGEERQAMSKFIDAVLCELTGRKRVVQWPIRVSLRKESDGMLPATIVANEYRVGVSWGTRFVLEEPAQMEMARENIIRELRHAVYGDLISLVHGLEKAIIENDMEKALLLIREILGEVHGTQ
jgi:hypothetical protein